MRSLLIPALFALLTPVVACGGDDGGGAFGKAQCHDGQDNDGDGKIDFPDDDGCIGDDDDDESDAASPKCKDGRDNDGDGKIDFPTDPGCFAPNQDDEEDDCPDGVACPQCSNGKDDDGNGSTDYPSDSAGCTSASDIDEYTRNPVACGSNVTIKPLPFDGHVTNGMILSSGASSLASPMCGGAGLEDVYELRIMSPKVVVATTDNPGTSIDTVLYIRGANCSSANSEMTCNDNLSTTNTKSSVTQSISQPGTYYLVVDTANTSVTGGYELSVKYLTGEGETCNGPDDCGPGLICRVPKGGTQKMCSKHVCDDNVDEDNDGKLGFPDDPGCTNKDDDDETDGCPGVGPNCPECGDGFDNDGDMKTDFGTNGDATCTSASSASEACVATDGVTLINSAMTMGTTVGAINDVKVSCATTGTHTAPDKTYRLDLPAMAQLVIDNVNTFDAAVALYNSTCTGTVLQCGDEPEKLTLTNLAAGTYYYVVDGWSTASGPYTINVSGKIQNGESCESPLAQAGAITCNTGYACKGTAGMRKCQPARCSDGLDNDVPPDNKVDYPADPGCASPADDDEADPVPLPVCSDGLDNDVPADNLVDYPADYGCVAASGTSEKFCQGEMDPTALITTKTTTGTTAGKANDFNASCPSSSAAPDVTFALQLPVAVATLSIDTNGSAFDTALVVRDAQCAAELFCDDDSGNSTQSLLTLTGVAPGSYAIIVDGYTSQNGAFTLNVQGTVAAGTSCTSSLFTGGANAVLVCPTGTTCTGSPAKCQ